MRKMIILLFFSQRTPLHAAARDTCRGNLEVFRLLVESKVDVIANDRCFSPPPRALTESLFSLTICLAVMQQRWTTGCTGVGGSTTTSFCRDCQPFNVSQREDSCPPTKSQPSPRQHSISPISTFAPSPPRQCISACTKFITNLSHGDN